MKEPAGRPMGMGVRGLKGKISAEEREGTIILIESIFPAWPDVADGSSVRGRLANVVRERLGHFPIKFSSFKRDTTKVHEPRVQRRLDFATADGYSTDKKKSLIEGPRTGRYFQREST